jgi:hypothetical protein
MPGQSYRPSSHPIAVLLAVTVGALFGLLIVAQLQGQSSEKVDRIAALKSVNLADLPDAELQQLAADVLSRITENNKLIGEGAMGRSDAPNRPLDPKDIELGFKNARRLLPLAKRLTLETLREQIKVTSLTKEARLIASVNHLMLDPTLNDSAEVREEDLSRIWIGPDYATDLTLDDEAILLLSHELTHVAVRSGRLNNFIDSVTTTARLAAGIELNHVQKEELACDFAAAEVLKRFIATHPTGESSSLRFSLAFGYEPPDKRLTRAWADFCASYRGDSRDGDHLSRDQTIRSLVVLDQDLKAFVRDDTLATRFCH